MQPSPPGPLPQLRGRGGAVALICGLAVAALLLLTGQLWLMLHLSWTHREAPAPSLVGINFSCDQAEFLLLEEPGGPFVPDDRPGRAAWCAETLERLVDMTGAKSIRLSIQWDEIQPEPGRYDWETMEELLRIAEEKGVTVSLSVGMKAQRHPEYYIPSWALKGTNLREGDVISDNPLLRARALEMVAVVVRRLASRTVIDSWGAENEGYIASGRSDNWRLSREYVAEVVRTLRANDPAARPISINHAQHFVMDTRWQDALADSDILGQSMYPRRNVDFLWFERVVNIMELGPLMPNYAHQSRTARETGKQFWVTELQGEPWTDGDSRLISPEEPSGNLSPEAFKENVIYARKTGAERIYLWGAEWWLYQSDQFGDDRWLEAARGATSGNWAPFPRAGR